MATNTGHAEMPYRVLGSTKEQVSAIGLGGWHLGLKKVDEPLSIRIIRDAIHRGINFMDNCWDYNDGASEIRMGKALRDGYRSKVFLMTKIDGRSKKEAARQIEESLRRLQTDCIDLVQHHEILRYEDPHRIFDDDGAHAALIEARKAESSATSASPATRTRAFTSICSRWQSSSGSSSIRCRCRSTSWTRTTGALKNWFCPSS